MIFERTKSAGIAHNSYLIGSGSDTAVVDPCRDWRICGAIELWGISESPI
jgi:flavorubredoxin